MELRKISNWGNNKSMLAKVSDIKEANDIATILNGSCCGIARGNGRSYGDASMGDVVMTTKSLNRILNIDLIEEFIEVEAGVLIGEILECIIPSGYFLAVVPGTKYVSVGGAIASDIHGKNHSYQGSFSSIVESLLISDAMGNTVYCSPRENPLVFQKIFGAMGMTGVVLKARIKIQKIETAYINQISVHTSTLEELIDLYQNIESEKYAASWLNLSPKNNNKTVSAITAIGSHHSLANLPQKLKANPLKYNPKSIFSIAFLMPSNALNGTLLRIFNALKEFLFEINKKSKVVDLNSFFFPLDKIKNWNLLYGKNGLIQYQFVVPHETSAKALKEIIEAINNSDEKVFLAVLKRMGKSTGTSGMNFAIEGFTLSLDFKVRPTLFPLLDHLDKIVIDHGGKIYLAKDVRMSAEIFRKMYPEVGSTNFGFSSALSKRLKLHDV